MAKNAVVPEGGWVYVEKEEDGSVLEVSQKAYDLLLKDKPGFSLVEEKKKNLGAGQPETTKTEGGKKDADK